ncbi:MAG: hypothetical protein EB127_12915 [Alphaproteobacteria bacterium]|nr:hypothetical protein [Alphaproteobacteria bacterium]
MDEIGIIVMLIAVLALVGIIIYFVYTYMKDKDAIDSRITKTSGMVDAEKSDRLSNIKYVVDEVNKVNADILKTMTTSNMVFNTSLSANSKKISTINDELSGFGKIIQFSSNNAVLQMSDLPGVTGGGVNMTLLGQVMSSMGLTGKDLVNHPVILCGGTDTSKNCLKFPDENGNTYLTSLSDGKNITLASPTNVMGAFTTSNLVNICNAKGEKCSTFDTSTATPTITLNGTTNIPTGSTLAIPLASLQIEGKAVTMDAATRTLKVAP